MKSDAAQVFFNCPHRCILESEYEDGIAHLYANRSPRPVRIVRTVQRLARWIVQVNASFDNNMLPPQVRIVDLYSEDDEVGQAILFHPLSTSEHLQSVLD